MTFSLLSASVDGREGTGVPEHGKDREMAAASEGEELEVLRTKGKRITAQRSLLLEVIRESRGHLDADEIYRRARSKDPRISLSTVYRNLNLLKELGLVSELHLDEEHHHYELREETDHYHLICSGCGRVMEFESPLAAQMAAEVEEKQGFLTERTHIDLVGLCNDCRVKRR
jgi:Fur family ferric uptake transcriptional regulator